MTLLAALRRLSLFGGQLRRASGSRHSTRTACDKTSGPNVERGVPGCLLHGVCVQAPLMTLLSRNKLKPSDVDAVELLGGGSRVPKLQSVLSEALGGRWVSCHPAAGRLAELDHVLHPQDLPAGGLSASPSCSARATCSALLGGCCMPGGQWDTR